MPPYSSVFSPQEIVWGHLKIEWAKFMAQKREAYDIADIEQDLARIMDALAAKLDFRILDSTAAYMRASLAGRLV